MLWPDHQCNCLSVFDFKTSATGIVIFHLLSLWDPLFNDVKLVTELLSADNLTEVTSDLALSWRFELLFWTEEGGNAEGILEGLVLLLWLPVAVNFDMRDFEETWSDELECVDWSEETDGVLLDFCPDGAIGPAFLCRVFPGSLRAISFLTALGLSVPTK